MSSVSATTDGSRVVSASRDGTVRVWRVSDGAPLATFPGEVRGVAISGDGWRAVSVGADKSVRVWDLVASGSRDSTVRVREFGSGRERAILEGHRDAVLTVAFASSSLLLSGSADRTIAAWDLQGL